MKIIASSVITIDFSGRLGKLEFNHLFGSDNGNYVILFSSQLTIFGSDKVRLQLLAPVAVGRKP